MKRTEAVLNNHQNALSYLQVQDGALETVGNIVSRMAELRTMAADVTKNTAISRITQRVPGVANSVKQIQFRSLMVCLFSSDAATSSISCTVSICSTATYKYVDHKVTLNITE